MKSAFLQQISPFIILLVAYLFSSGLPRIFYLALPASTLCLHLYYPQSVWLQIAFITIWGLHVLATWRISGYSIESIYKYKLLIGVLIAGSAVLSVFLLWWWNPEVEILVFAMFFLFLVWLFYFLILRPIAYFVVAPFFCKNRTTITTTLVDYRKALSSPATSKKAGTWHSYIRFKDDPIEYEVESLQFNKYRKKIDIPFSYEKCECLFGFTYIRKVRPLNSLDGRSSEWDLAPSTQTRRKIDKILVIIAIIGLAFFIILFMATSLI